MDLKRVHKSRITDDLKAISLIRQLFPVKDSAEDLDLILEMASYNLSAEDVIKKFDSDEYRAAIGENYSDLMRGFEDFLSDYANAPESLDDSIFDYCQHSNISFDNAVDALNQWLTPQLKSELVELF